MRPVRIAALLTAAVVMSACGSQRPEAPVPVETPGAYACPPGDLLVEGNPLDKPVFDALIADYGVQCRNTSRITFSTDRDGGATSFVNGLVHIAAADAALDPKQSEQAVTRCLDNPAWHLPVAVDPIAVVHRVDGVGELALSPTTLARIFTGTITDWDDPAIAAENPGETMPSARIEVFFGSARSGTTAALSEYLHVEAPELWPFSGTQSWRGKGVGMDSQEQLLDAVRTTPYSLGYVAHSALPSSVTTPTPTPSPSPTATHSAIATAAPSATPGTATSASSQEATGAPGGTTPGRTPLGTASPTPTPTTATTPASVPPRLVRLGLANGPVELTDATAQRAVDGMQSIGPGPDLVIDPASLAADPAAWPIHRVSYQVLCSAGLRTEWTVLEQDWLRYLVTTPGQDALAESGRIALPEAFAQRVRGSIDTVR